MPSFFTGIEVGRRALAAQQRALVTVGHNIANATTPGYSRQEAVMRASAPHSPPGVTREAAAGQLGTGVEVAQIRRYRDAFLDRQVRTESTALGYWEMRESAFGVVQGVISEPSDRGLRSELSLFWSAVQEVANHPELSAARSTLRQRGVSLTSTFRQIYSQIEAYQANIDQRVRSVVADINTIGQQVADLNTEIIHASSAGDLPNDLRDRRDLLLDQLSKLVDFHWADEPRGSVSVFINGIELVAGSKLSPISVTDDPLNNNFARLDWPQAGVPVLVKDGELRSLLDLRDADVPRLLNDLTTIATALVNAVNAQHAAGVGLNGSTGNNFFTMPLGVKSMDVDAAIMADLNNIAAAQAPPPPATPPYPPPPPGDGGNMLAIGALRNANLIAGAKIDDFYHGVVSSLGVDGQEAARLSENQRSLVDFVENQRQAVQGVSLDEEMTRMIQLETGYRAAARLISAIDQAIDSVLQMGVVGR